MSIATEIVTFKTAEGVVRESFIKIVDELERDFHSKEPGFIDTELLYNDKAEEWIMIQHWDSLENMKLASANMFRNPVTAAFVRSLNPKTVNMQRFMQLGSWNCVEP